MAKSATIYKVELQVSDLDRHYYHTHALTVAQHPSETEQRMMVRILAFALNASEYLEFTKGLSTDDVGQPSAKRVKKACNQSEKVSIYTFSGHSAEVWRQQNKADFARQPKLNIIDFPIEQLSELTQCVVRTMSLQCTIQDGLIWFGDAQNSIEIAPVIWQDSA